MKKEPGILQGESGACVDNEGEVLTVVAEMEGIALCKDGRQSPGPGNAIGAIEDGFIGLAGGGRERDDAHTLLLRAEGSDRVAGGGKDSSGSIDSMALVVCHFEGQDSGQTGNEVAAFGEE